MQKSSTIDHPISDLIRSRKSTRSFASRGIELDKINSLFEATRWAPSSSNEQPWIYIYALPHQKELWDKLFSPLNESNKIWAKDAGLLIASLARKEFTRFGTTNSHALYDLGAANAFLALQAVELGLQVRQIAGFSVERVIENLKVPATFEVGVLMAVGYPGDPESLPENLRQRELAPRERYMQGEFVMNKTF